jgi:glycosyltransferase involved in cell wall biosynthesis
MSARTLFFVVPGEIETKTGGYGYDRRIVAGLRLRGWTVQVVSLPGRYPSPTERERGAARRALAAIPDQAHVLVDGLAFGVLAAEAALERSRLRLIALVHHPLGLEQGIDAAGVNTLLASERAALETCRGVVVTSLSTVSAVEALGVERDRIVVVEPGTDQAPAAAGSGGPVCQMLCVASLIPRKGHDTLLDALERLTHLSWHLTCVGRVEHDSVYAAALERRCDDGPLAGRVTLAGELSGAVLDRAYHTTDLLVLPTRYEGYGMAVAEALARGVPVVSTPTGAIAALVGRDAGVLVPPADVDALARALAALIEHPAHLERLREGAIRTRGSLPTWDVACALMEEALVRFAER